MRIPQTYYPRESPVHRADARVKIALVLAFTIALFAVTTWPALGLLAAALLLVLAASRLPVGVLAKSLLPLYVLMAFALLFNSLSLDPQATAQAYGVGGVSAGILEGAAPVPLAMGWYLLPDGFARAGFYCVRVMCLVLASLVLAYSTRATELTAAIAWILRPLERPLRAIGIRASDIAFVFALVLRFIPMAFEELEFVKKAQMARGARFEVGGLWQRVWAWRPVLVPWLVSLYRRAGRIATAMDARAYGLVEPRGSLSRMRCRPADWAILAAGLALCAGACFL